MNVRVPKILFVCSRNERRSLTAEEMFRHDPSIDVRSGGTSPQARHVVSTHDIWWADVIICMENKHRDQLQRLFSAIPLPVIHVANIPDDFAYNDPELQELLRDQVDQLLVSEPDSLGD